MTTEVRVWTKEEISTSLQTNDAFLARSIVKLFEFQTYDEQATEYTRHHNNVGFNGVDAPFLSSLAKWYEQKGFLTPKQTARARRQMKKYAGQLTRIANNNN
jgi:hypothetical protein